MSADPREEILEIFRDSLGIVLTSTDVDVIDTGVLDSLSLVTLLVEVEQRFGRKISFETLTLDDFRTVDALARLVSNGSG